MNYQRTQLGAVAVVLPTGSMRYRWAQEHAGDIIIIVDVPGGPGWIVQYDESKVKCLYDDEFVIISPAELKTCECCGNTTLVTWWKKCLLETSTTSSYPS